MFSVDKAEMGLREQKAALNAVASNSIASLSNFLPTGCVVYLVVDRVRTVSDR